MKFLTDAQTSQLFVDLLRRHGWDVRTAHEEQIHYRTPDYLVIATARFLGRVFITFDHLRAESGAQVARELRSRGGKVIKIGGGPGQPPERAFGKLMFHYELWYPFLEETDGLVDIRDIGQRCRLFSTQEYLQRANPAGFQYFEGYLSRLTERRTEIRQQRAEQFELSEQAHMDLGNIDSPSQGI